MNKNISKYTQLWVILLAVFATVVFVVRPVIPGFTFEYDTRFWIAFSSIIAAFAVNLVCACITFRAKNLTRLFYNVPLIEFSLGALIATTAVGTVLMLIPNCPVRIVVIVCILAFALNLATLIGAAWASSGVQKIDKKVKTQTSFCNNATLQAETILAGARSESIKSLCKRVCEAVRYSDPMSSDALSVLEAKITVKMDELSAAVRADDAGKVKEAADEIAVLVSDRNKKCRALK